MNRRDFLKMASALAAAVTYPSFVRAEVGTNEYEYIIVGSGAGGGPLAVNLAKAGKSVLLIEAGGDRLPLSALVPAYNALASEDPTISWDFFVKHSTRREDHSKWFRNPVNGDEGVLYPRASVLGGCTEHNAMICMLPDADDWNKLQQLTGDASWSAMNMRALFDDKIENAQYFTDKTKGWSAVEMTPISLLKKDSMLQKIVFGAADFQYELYDEAQKALLHDAQNTFRLNSYLDINEPRLAGKTGFMRVPKYTYKGMRYGVFNYLAEAKIAYGKNLTIIPDTLVKKIVFAKNPSGQLRAIGVEALKGANLYSAHKLSQSAVIREEVFYKASKEVILSGGAFNTPQLLMLSGIGPADQFSSKRAGAPIKDEPLKILEGVGRNLQDRYETTIVTELGKDLDILKDCKFAQEPSELGGDPCFQEWLNQATREKSVYASNGVLAAIKMRSSHAQPKKTDLVLFGVPGDFRGYYPGYAKDASAHKNKFTWAILKGHSRNRSGRVTLKNDDPRSTPDIQFNFFNGPGASEDMQAVMDAMKSVRGLNHKTFDTALDALKSSSDPGKSEVYPGRDINTDEKLQMWIQRESWGHHASCTAKIGLHENDGSVIDGDFKVHGTENLRIVDASVFPEIPGLFIVTPIYMISEKASDVILGKKKKS